MKAEKGINLFEHEITKDSKETALLFKEKGTLLNKADNGKYYLPMGAYTLEVEIKDKKATVKFKKKRKAPT